MAKKTNKPTKRAATWGKKAREAWAEKTTQMPFPVSVSDHAETPLDAYRDLAPALSAYEAHVAHDLVIYDPYYADGGCKAKLASLGFESVVNERRDFYKDLENDETPPHDVLVTNPPYSGEHIQKIVAFAVSSPRPFALLVPIYVVAKDYWRSALDALDPPPFYCLPNKRYAYEPPAWARRHNSPPTTSPFHTAWFCWFPHDAVPKDVFPRHRVRLFLSADNIPATERDVTDPHKKRPNPRLRKRLKAKRAEQARNYYRAAS